VQQKLKGGNSDPVGGGGKQAEEKSELNTNKSNHDHKTQQISSTTTEVTVPPHLIENKNLFLAHFNIGNSK
jgi:hypothetical protein